MLSISSVCVVCGSTDAVRSYPDYDDGKYSIRLCRDCGADYLSWCREVPSQEECAPENAPSWSNDAGNL